MGKRTLEGKKIALAGSRRVEEMSKLVESFGGIPLPRPVQGTVLPEEGENLERRLIEWVRGDMDWFIFTTGIGIQTLLNTAQRMGIEQELVERLKQAKLAGRGYKVAGELKKLGLQCVVHDDDGTTKGLVRALSPYEFEGCSVALQLPGEPVPNVVQLLGQKGARVHEILPYRHEPNGTDLLDQLVNEILNGEVDAVAFTSGSQVRFVFSYARKRGLHIPLVESFSSRTAAVAVGKYTAGCLREEGVGRVIVPKVERMGSMIVALSRYYESIEKGTVPKTALGTNLMIHSANDL
ncbi:uroporphyrinogen-III synthase [Lihuaxuella thermophila]|uniref:Uroporphyrinogen-III synthase n=1 Tax=Lihuaxuella thermophila TaxID=1173111 RepID=A0A1H8INP7_9BACL|nr:uroporphyrinogen-III synthase [Lihuaxuella thermophila]SEN69695.1 uroporphyrinogen-III synthase [Lihuaxuella thermophila]